MKFLVPIAFVAILSCLGLALYYMLSGGRNGGKTQSQRMAKALAVRVGVSIALFLCVLLGWKLGWLHPTGLPLHG